MKYLRLGVGCDRISPSSVRLTCDIGFESTKPASEKIRNAAVSLAALVGLLWALNATPDVDAHPAITIDVVQVIP